MPPARISLTTVPTETGGLLPRMRLVRTYRQRPHHRRRRPNQQDYALHMAQFFDYELKGAAKPAWMEKGVPYLHTPEQFAPGN